MHAPGFFAVLAVLGLVLEQGFHITAGTDNMKDQYVLMINAIDDDLLAGKKLQNKWDRLCKKPGYDVNDL